MNKVLIITGDLATGKSTFAYNLSQKLHILLLTKDKIKELLADYIGFNDRSENLKLSASTLAIMFYLLSEANKIEIPLILEANFHQKDIDTLYNLTYDKTDVLVLNLTGDFKILYDRFIKRIKEEGRHKAHQSAGLEDYSKFCHYLEEGRKITFSQFKHIDINANDFNYQEDEKLFHQIVCFLGGK